VYCLGCYSGEGGLCGLRGTLILSNPSGKIQRLGLFRKAVIRLVASWCWQSMQWVAGEDSSCSRRDDEGGARTEWLMSCVRWWFSGKHVWVFSRWCVVSGGEEGWQEGFGFEGFLFRMLGWGLAHGGWCSTVVRGGGEVRG
jgi:hypothetical protein